MGCIATFTDNAVTITHNTNKVLCGTKLPTSNLWTISLPLNSTPAFAAAAALTLSTDTDFVRFTHAALGSPSLSTFVKAVRRGYLHLYLIFILYLNFYIHPISYRLILRLQ